LAARLDDAFRVLTSASRTVPGRQQTLRATLDWSHGLLTTPEQTVFRRLAVFAGGWEPEAAEAVGSGGGIDRGDVLELLTHLVDKSLVQLGARDGHERYRLLEPLRQYAQERLAESGEEHSVRRRHAEYYLALTLEAEPKVRGPEQHLWFGRLARELDNLRAVLTWSHSPEGDCTLGLRLGDSVWPFWSASGSWGDVGRAFERLLPGCSAAPSAVRGRAYVNLAMITLYAHRGTSDRPVAIGRQGLELARASGGRESIALACMWLATAMGYRGGYA